MGQVNWTNAAERWLQEIYEYIQQDNPDAALRTVRGIRERVRVLADYPEIGAPYADRARRPIRILLYGHYRIAYRVKQDGVDILGVFHGSLDIERFLGERT